jgi:hypothetical protein
MGIYLLSAVWTQVHKNITITIQLRKRFPDETILPSLCFVNGITNITVTVKLKKIAAMILKIVSYFQSVPAPSSDNPQKM